MEEYNDSQAGELSNETKFVEAGREWPKKGMKFKNGLVLAERVSEGKKIDKMSPVYLYVEKVGGQQLFSKSLWSYDPEQSIYYPDFQGHIKAH